MSPILSRESARQRSSTRALRRTLVETRGHDRADSAPNRGRLPCGAGVLAGAVLLAVPIPLLPLTNPFPALGILLFALGRPERDGLLTLLGSGSLLLSVAIFGAFGASVALLGWDAVQGVLASLGWS